MATSKRYFYHSFRRPLTIGSSNSSYETEFAILESILKSGLLLTPERLTFNEPTAGGGQGAEWIIDQKRICFTELDPRELRDHSTNFGPFAFEWEIDTLRAMGAVPAFYVPMFPTPGSLDGAATSMLARIGEINRILDRLIQLRSVIAKASPGQTVDLTTNGKVINSRATVEAAAGLLTLITERTRPLDELAGAIRWLGGLFYPVDNPKYPGPLRYYRQREWKILGNMVKDGTAVTRSLSQTEIDDMLALNAGFFGKMVQFRTGLARVVDQCQIFEVFQGKHVINTVRRLIVPGDAQDEAIALIKGKGFDLEVVSLESIGKDEAK